MIQQRPDNSPRVPISQERIADFCRRWKVSQFSLFGSVLRDDFRPESDVDVLVVFEPGTSHTWKSWCDMVDELRAMFGRDVDVVERRLIINPYRRHEILTTRRVLYAA